MQDARTRLTITDIGASCNRCGGDIFDVLYEFEDRGLRGRVERRTMLQCCYCMQTKPSVWLQRADQAGSFRLRYGRFEGLTLDEVWEAGSVGKAYLAVLQKDRGKMGKIIASWMADRCLTSLE